MDNKSIKQSIKKAFWLLLIDGEIFLGIIACTSFQKNKRKEF